MDYNKLLQQKSHLPTTRHLTVKFYFVIVLILTVHTTDVVLGSTLGSKCQHDMDCTDFIKGSSCSAQGYCECAPYFVQYNTTTCLSSQLLGGDCTLNEQCTMKVANSSCLDGACRCVEGFLQFRKHTCLGPAPPGSVCYSHAHCQMFSTRTHCDFLIPNLFGRCQCTAPAKLKAGLCVDSSMEEALAAPSTTTTSTTTTPQPLRETELPLITGTSEQETHDLTTTSSNSLDSADIVNKVQPEIETDAAENVSIEEQAWEDDKDLPLPTSKTPSQTPTERLTPTEFEEHPHLQATEANEAANAIDLSSVTEDYPYKIETGDFAHTQTQKLDTSEDEDSSLETILPDEEDQEDHNEEYGHVIDNTMNFDYEAGQEEVENSLEMESSSEVTTEVEKQDQAFEPPKKYDYSEQYSQEVLPDQAQENSQTVENIPPQNVIEHKTEALHVEQHQEDENESQDKTNPGLEQDDGNISGLENNIVENVAVGEENQENELEIEEEKLEQMPEQQHEDDHVVQDSEQQTEGAEEQHEEQKSDEQQEKLNEEQEQDQQPQEVFLEENEAEQQQVHKELETEQQQNVVQEENEAEQQQVHKEPESEQQHNDVHEEQETEPDDKDEEELQTEMEQISVTEPEDFEEKETAQQPDYHQDVATVETDHEPILSDLESNVEQAVSQNELETQTINDVVDTHDENELELEDAQDHKTYQHAESELQPETHVAEHEDTQHHDLTNEQESEHIDSIASEQEEDHELQHVSGIETHEAELESLQTPEPEKKSDSPQTQEALEPTQELYAESKPLESHEIEEDNHLSIEQQNLNNEHIHAEDEYLQQAQVNVQHKIEELEHTIANNNLLVPQQQDSEKEEHLSESPTNEIHHDQNFDVKTAENESVQDENEDTAQQQMHETTEVQDYEVITTQPAKLQEEDEIKEEQNVNNSHGQQQISDAAQQHEFHADNDQQIMDKEEEEEEEGEKKEEEEKFGENSTEGQIADTSNDEKHQDILQETTESHTDINQLLSTNFEEHKGNKATEIFHVINDDGNEELNSIEQEQEFVTEGRLESAKENLAENQNISPEKISSIEYTTMMPALEDEVAEIYQYLEHNKEENSSEELSNTMQETEDRDEIAENHQKVDSTEDITDHQEAEHKEIQLAQTNDHQHTENIQSAPESSESLQDNSSANEAPQLVLIGSDSETATLNEHIDSESNESEEDNLLESTTLTAQGGEETQEEDFTENMETNQIQEESEAGKPPQHDNTKEEVLQENPATTIHKDEDNISQTTRPEPEVQSNSESFQTNQVPSNNIEYSASSVEHQSHDNKVIPEPEGVQDTHETQPQNTYLSPDHHNALKQPESQEFKESESISDILNNLMKEDVTLEPEYTVDAEINDNLQESDVADLLAEDTNISEESVLSQQVPAQDLTEAPIDPEDKLITFYPDMQDLQPVQQMPITSQQELEQEAVEEPSKDEDDKLDFSDRDINNNDIQPKVEPQAVQRIPINNEAEIQHEALEEFSGDEDDKLHLQDKEITNNEEHPVEEQQAVPINSEQEMEQEAFEESSGDQADTTHLQDNAISENAEHQQAEQYHTLSPLDLPFDTSVDYEPQQFEADSLIVETTTLAASELKPHDIEQTVETTTKPGALDEITTQTMLNLASRVTLMEPAAPVSTTLMPLMPLNTNEEVTSVPALDAPVVEILLTTKPSIEIRKRVELSLEAVSLGLSCSNSEQCRLADPHTICNAQGVCDCAANVYTTHNQKQVQCSAQRTGCAEGTFQCRSSGACISWFFVCDGRSDCNDASDEECTFNARRNQTCPSQAFQCGQSGRCISRAALCDGHKQCPQGEDEIGCRALRAEDSCPPHTFRCKSGECLPEYEYCNAIISCRDGSDEPPLLCGSRSVPNFFLRLLTAGGLMGRQSDTSAYCPHRCSNGRCRSTAIVCSGRDGCGDGTDEQTCSVCKCPAVNMEKPAITMSDYLARHRSMPLW